MKKPEEIPVFFDSDFCIFRNAIPQPPFLSKEKTLRFDLTNLVQVSRKSKTVALIQLLSTI
ncbi:hypothetical protein CH380_16045 [Leptospira adleri]|uniref:Uncharacterized protein n=1 Tax=Leptospira adleri TaxID=2023186 RepID=A0A2M9YKV7_9LEPT|nr:hypothetical protein CH380_16045 [Leptospira adleri]PJZ63236.1 hypothetical protein CH376_04195 [Leptospira adleri]